jgi:ketosteroid isomerase-like protein
MEVNMDSSSAATDSDSSKIAVLREAWLAAVKAGDAESLAQMLTDNVVVVHGNGRCVCGKEAVRADFFEGFRRFAIDQKVSPTEVIVGFQTLYANPAFEQVAIWIVLASAGSMSHLSDYAT